MFSNYLRNSIQNHIFLKEPLVIIPDSIYIGLSKTTPTPDGKNVTEPTGGGYSRLKFDRTSVDFTESENGVVKNKLRKNYNETTDAWGTCTHYVVFDNNTEGNLLWYGELTRARNIDVEMQVFIDANDLSFALE